MGIGITAEWRCQLYDYGLMTYDSGWMSNVVCTEALKILSGEVKKPDASVGFKYLAIGNGSSTGNDDAPDPSTWDTSPPPASASRTQMVGEVYRFPLAANHIKFIDEFNDVSGVATNRVLAEVTIPPNTATGIHREYGLIVSSESQVASAAANTGILFNYETHGKIEKAATEEARLRVRIKFEQKS